MAPPSVYCRLLCLFRLISPPVDWSHNCFLTLARKKLMEFHILWEKKKNGCWHWTFCAKWNLPFKSIFHKLVEVLLSFSSWCHVTVLPKVLPCTVNAHSVTGIFVSLSIVLPVFTSLISPAWQDTILLELSASVLLLMTPTGQEVPPPPFPLSSALQTLPSPFSHRWLPNCFFSFLFFSLEIYHSILFDLTVLCMNFNTIIWGC